MLGHISIRNRLVSVVLATAMLAIVVAFTIVIYNEVSSIKKDAERNLLVNAELVADYCIDPLVQNRPENAVRVLEKIGIIPAVTHLQLYDSVDSLFASYRTESEEVIPPVGLRPGKLLAREYAVHLRVPVVQKGHNYGTLYLRASNEALHGRISNYIYTMALFVLGLILLIYLLVLRLQNIISAPILQLARIAEKISNEGDLSLRVNRRQRDEFAVLYENFNIMLESLHTRQSHLAAEKEELELKL